MSIKQFFFWFFMPAVVVWIPVFIYKYRQKKALTKAFDKIYLVATNAGFVGTRQEWFDWVNSRPKLIEETETERVKNEHAQTVDIGIAIEQAYQHCWSNGYQGTFEEWRLENNQTVRTITLAKEWKKEHQESAAARANAYRELVDIGEEPKHGKSAYELAVELGYPGTKDQWIKSLRDTNAGFDTTHPELVSKGTDPHAQKPIRTIHEGPNGSYVEIYDEREAAHNQLLDRLFKSTMIIGEVNDFKRAYNYEVDNHGYQGKFEEWIGAKRKYYAENPPLTRKERRDIEFADRREEQRQVNELNVREQIQRHNNFVKKLKKLSETGKLSKWSLHWFTNFVLEEAELAMVTYNSGAYPAALMENFMPAYFELVMHEVCTTIHSYAWPGQYQTIVVPFLKFVEKHMRFKNLTNVLYRHKHTVNYNHRAQVLVETIIEYFTFPAGVKVKDEAYLPFDQLPADQMVRWEELRREFYEEAIDDHYAEKIVKYDHKEEAKAIRRENQTRERNQRERAKRSTRRNRKHA